MNSVSYDTSCNGGMRWDGDGDGDDVGDDVDDDLNDACDDGDDDGDDLPFREVISPAESSCRRWLFFSVGFRHGAAVELRKLFFFRFLGNREDIGQRGEPGWPRVSRRPPGTTTRGARHQDAWAPSGPPPAPLRPTSVILRKNASYKFLVHLEVF